MNKETNKYVIYVLAIIAMILAIIVVILFVQRKVENSKVSQSIPVTTNAPMNLSEKITNINIVPTMEDNILPNTAWCGTFQLVWNDMQNNLVDGNVEFEESNEMVTNLNKQKFTEKSIPEDYYYKKWGLMNLSLKAEIEQEIKNKFNETSDILDLFRWPSENEIVKDKYFFYSILRRNFGFENEFSVLENNKFGNTENIEYFGINEETDEIVRNQVEVLYYTDKENFAVVLHTKQNDQVMLVRNPDGDTFEDIYKNVDKDYKKYKGSTDFGEKDTLSVPNLNIDILKEYTELENKPFKTKNEETASIEQAFQTIQMTLNNKGGSIKSEAGMAVTKGIKEKNSKPREFNFNDKFAIFLISETNEPYFAANIENIELFK